MNTYNGRRKKKGWPSTPNSGYRSPRISRGLHPSGFNEILVHNIKDLDEIQSHQAIRISQTVGRRKRAEIVEKAQKLAIHVLNKRMRTDETF